MADHEPGAVQATATAAPEASANIHPRFVTITGIRDVDKIPPEIPAVFMIPKAAPAFSAKR
jgi:hypothetical protein